MNYRQTFAEINLTALSHNLKTLKSLVSSDTFFCPMIKSFAYGHGDIEVAETLVSEGIRILGVALVEEGIRLREGGISDAEILIFGPFNYLGAKAIIKHKLTPVVSDRFQFNELLEALEEAGSKIDIHLKFNTGMNRLGYSIDEIDDLTNLLEKNKSSLTLKGVCSHLASGEDLGAEESFSKKQYDLFSKIISEFQKFTEIQFHLLNSSGFIGSQVLKGNRDYKNIESLGVRPGLALFGVTPSFKNTNAQEFANKNIGLKPVMCLKTEVIQFHNLSPGESVSYGGRWTAQKKSLIGVLPIGYADGYTRQLSNKGMVVILGKKLPVIGTVCMDYTLVDLTKLLIEGIIKQSEEALGIEVIMFGFSLEGNGLPIEEVAESINTISYELMTCIGKRVPRQYLKEHL